MLCLYGLGTNAGLKRVSAGTDDASYAELLHVRHRFIHKEALRSATALVTNAILAMRDRRIWGEAGSACASDSTKIGAPPRPPGRVSCGDRIDRLLTVDGTRT